MQEGHHLIGSGLEAAPGTRAMNCGWWVTTQSCKESDLLNHQGRGGNFEIGRICISNPEIRNNKLDRGVTLPVQSAISDFRIWDYNRSGPDLFLCRPTACNWTDSSL